MDIDFIIGISAAAVAATALTFLLVRWVLSLARGGGGGGGGSVRSLLALPAMYIHRKSMTDMMLRKELEAIDKMIVQAGGRFLDGATAEEVFAARYVFPVLGIAVIASVGVILQLSGGLVFIGAVFFAALLYGYPRSALKAAAAERARKFTHDLPASLDIMRLVSQAGGDLYAAIGDVVAVSEPGPVREELSRAMLEVAIGTSLATALNNVGERIGTSDANAVFSTLAQSLEMGTSVGENLAAASSLIRHAARVRAQAQAQKAVVAMSFPLLLLILPGIFIVLFAPMIIQFMNR